MHLLALLHNTIGTANAGATEWAISRNIYYLKAGNCCSAESGTHNGRLLSGSLVLGLLRFELLLFCDFLLPGQLYNLQWQMDLLHSNTTLEINRGPIV